MKAKCLQEVIHRALQITSRVTPGRTSMPILQNTLIQAEGEMLHLVATNLEMTVRMSLPATIEREGALAVPNQLLGDFISALPRDVVELEQPENTTQMRLTCGLANANINSASASLFPPSPEVGSSTSVLLTAGEFKKAVGRVAFCAASDSGRPVLTGILLHLKDGQLTTVGADGLRVAIQRTTLETPPEIEINTRVVVPARIMNEVQRIVSNNGEHVEIVIPAGEKHVRFRIGSEEPQSSDIEVISQLLVDTYPDYQGLIPEEMPNQAVFALRDLQWAIRRAALFARDDQHTVRFDMSRENGRERIIISSESKELGNNRAELPINDMQGSNIVIAFNNKFIQDALSVLDSKKVRLETNNRTTPVKIMIPEEDDYVHVFMPILTLENQQTSYQ